MNKIAGRGIEEGQIKTPQDGNNAMAVYKKPIHLSEESAKNPAEDAVKYMDHQKEMLTNIEHSTNRMTLAIVTLSTIFSITISVLLTGGVIRPVRQIVETL